MSEKTDDLLRQKQEEIEQLKKELRDASRPSALFSTLKKSVKRGVHEFFNREDKVKSLGARVKQLEKELEEANEENAQKEVILMAASHGGTWDKKKEDGDGAVENLMGDLPQGAEEALKKYFAPCDVGTLILAAQKKYKRLDHQAGTDAPAPEPDTDDAAPSDPTYAPEQEPNDDLIQPPLQEALPEPPEIPDVYAQMDGADTDWSDDAVADEAASMTETGTGSPAADPPEKGNEDVGLSVTEGTLSSYQTEKQASQIDADGNNEQDSSNPSDPVPSLFTESNMEQMAKTGASPDTVSSSAESPLDAGQISSSSLVDAHRSDLSTNLNESHTVRNTDSSPRPSTQKAESVPSSERTTIPYKGQRQNIASQVDKKRRRKKKKPHPDTENGGNGGTEVRQVWTENMERPEISFGFAESEEVTPPPIGQPWTVFSEDEFDDDFL